MVSLSPHGALGLLARIALAAVLSAALFNVAIPSAARAQDSEPPASQAEPKPEMREACPGLVAEQSAAGVVDGVQARRTQCRPGAAHIHRPLDLHDRKSGRRAHRHRLQRLSPAAGTAGYRHDEPCARHPFQRSSRPGDSICAARLGTEPGGAGHLGSEISRRTRPQRADQYPQLERRHRTLRQFDLRVRDRKLVHRPSRPSASHADPAAAQRDRPRRRV